MCESLSRSREELDLAPESAYSKINSFKCLTSSQGSSYSSPGIISSHRNHHLFLAKYACLPAPFIYFSEEARYFGSNFQKLEGLDVSLTYSRGFWGASD